MDQKRYKAVFFDLDGTLLPMDLEEFLGEYFVKLAEFVAGKGMDGKQFSLALKAGIKAMMGEHPGNNDQVFWETFYQVFGQNDVDMEKMLQSFYENEFGTIGNGIWSNPAAARAVDTLRAKGYPLVLTTMPLFPQKALDWRLKWAGVDPTAFSRMTTYDNSFSVKPALSYYQQNVDFMGCRPEDVLMVGNNTREDLSIMELGADAFLVTDCLLDPVDFPLDTVKHGTLEEFANWVEQLPDCEA